MPDTSDTLLDQYVALGTSRDKHRSKPRIQWRRCFALACHLLLESALYAISTVLITLGLPLFLFLLASGWDLLGLFTHLDNLSARYLEASSARRLMFSHDLKLVFCFTALLVAAIRMPIFIKSTTDEWAREEAS